MVERYIEYCNSPWGRFRSECILNNVTSFLDPERVYLSFLDIGCGPGQIIRDLAPSFKNGVAIDESEEMIKSLSERQPSVKYMVCPFDAFSCDTRFDLILCHNVLEYQIDKEAFLMKTSRFLRGRDSLLSLVVINRRKEILQHVKEGRLAEARRLHDDGLYTSQTFRRTIYLPFPEEFEELILRCGFRIVGIFGIGLLSPEDYEAVNTSDEVDVEMYLQKDGRLAAYSTLVHFLCKKDGPVSDV